MKLGLIATVAGVLALSACASATPGADPSPAPSTPTQPQLTTTPTPGWKPVAATDATSADLAKAGFECYTIFTTPTTVVQCMTPGDWNAAPLKFALHDGKVTGIVMNTYTTDVPKAERLHAAAVEVLFRDFPADTQTAFKQGMAEADATRDTRIDVETAWGAGSFQRGKPGNYFKIELEAKEPRRARISSTGLPGPASQLVAPMTELGYTCIESNSNIECEQGDGGIRTLTNDKGVTRQIRISAAGKTLTADEKNAYAIAVQTIAGDAAPDLLGAIEYATQLDGKDRRTVVRDFEVLVDDDEITIVNNSW
ncbi:hypothetical protein AADG42_03530 [Ammonicoccus fulvus]|uniref:Lipoprotein n=1 Tax=Ammonicoccus fulvus TaxID=3138240 RepID=A0ABZ3FLX8_9ACTN